MKLPKSLLFFDRPQVPIIFQTEASECGLACVAMIAKYHGHDVDLNGLRQKFHFSMSGATLRNLIEIFTELSLSTRALRLELETLPYMKLPAILHWEHNHFVVLKSINATRAVIHDPSKGEVKISLGELSSKFTGIALEVIPAVEFKPIEAKSPIKMSMLWGKLHGFYKAVSLILLVSILLQLVAFASPFYMQLVIDHVIGNFDSELLLVISISFLVLVIIQAVTDLLREWLLQLFGQQFVYQIVGNIVRHLLRLPTSYFETRHIGDILSRMQSVKIIQESLTRGLISTLIDGGMAIIAAAILFYYSPTLFAIVFISLCILTFINTIASPLLQQKTEGQLVALSKEQTYLMETIRAVVTIKLLGKEAEREATWRNLYIKQLNGYIYVGRIQLGLNFFRNLILGIQYILIVHLGVGMILEKNGFSVGMLMAFLSFRQTFSDRAASFITQLLQLKTVKVHIDRLGDIISQESEARTNILFNSESSGVLALENVSFRYGISDRFVLNEVNFSIKPGEFIAIKGVSGGGKTTLLKILMGLYEPTSGNIKLDNNLATKDAWRDWRSRCGFVLQDDRLLSGSIAENIAFFDDSLNMDKVIESAKSAQIHNEIVQKPMQYQTSIGDMGAALSGGQRQRILLARALYRNPEFLLLDEGTANLDEETEKEIALFIKQLPITRIVVAHRPALVELSDRQFELTEGKLVEITKPRNGLPLIS